jgi:NTP pyrophosphatase (non-canonical NTP hydrolase)
VTAPSALDLYQDAAARTINPALSDAHRLLDAAAGLAEEAGEVLSHVRKHVMQSRPLDREAVAAELGDALWCIAIVARSLDLPLSDVASRNLDKLAARYPHGFLATHERD